MHRLFCCFLALPLMAGSPVADGVNRFASDAWKHLSPQSGNLIFSPVSISTALSMALAGARGQTAGEMTAIVHTPVDAGFLNTLTRAGNAAGDELLLAQSLWVERRFPLLDAFVDQMKGQFQAAPVPQDFSGSPDSAREAINRWAEEKTKGKISGLFPPGTIDRSTRLVLASAIYFNGKWRSRFNPQETTSAPFHAQGGSDAPTSFMNQSARFGYKETANAQVLEMPYGGGSLVFDVILPKAATGLSAIEGALGADGISAWVGQLQHREVKVSLPKFRAESSFSLRPVLSRMGMANAFTDAADFSGMDGKHDLTLTEVRHKAFIDVSEQGTEAAAATGAVASLTAYAQPVVFRADHPFLYLIRDTGSGVILFAGRYVAPKL